MPTRNGEPEERAICVETQSSPYHHRLSPMKRAFLSHMPNVLPILIRDITTSILERYVGHGPCSSASSPNHHHPETRQTKRSKPSKAALKIHTMRKSDYIPCLPHPKGRSTLHSAPCKMVANCIKQRQKNARIEAMIAAPSPVNRFLPSPPCILF